MLKYLYIQGKQAAGISFDVVGEFTCRVVMPSRGGTVPNSATLHYIVEILSSQCGSYKEDLCTHQLPNNRAREFY